MSSLRCVFSGEKETQVWVLMHNCARQQHLCQLLPRCCLLLSTHLTHVFPPSSPSSPLEWRFGEGAWRYLEHIEVRKTNEIFPQQINMNWERSSAALEPGPSSVWADEEEPSASGAPGGWGGWEEVGRRLLRQKHLRSKRQCWWQVFFKDEDRFQQFSVDQEKWGGEKNCVAREVQDLLIGERNCKSLFSFPVHNSAHPCEFVPGWKASSKVTVDLMAFFFFSFPVGWERK